MYEVNYISGHSLKLKSVDVVAENEQAAVEKAFKMEGHNFENRLVSVKHKMQDNSMGMEYVRSKVAELLANDASGHGMDHIDRVLKLALKFAEKENADKNTVALIALLHDVDDHKLVGEESAKKLVNARRILTECDIDDATRNAVLDALSDIGYSKRLEGHVPKTIEGQVVSDADMCDAIGANGILRAHAYGLKTGHPFFDKNIFPNEDVTSETYTKTCGQTSVCHIFEKLLKLKDMMLTDSGKIEATKRHRTMTGFLYSLFEEEEALEWAYYLIEKGID